MRKDQSIPRCCRIGQKQEKTNALSLAAPKGIAGRAAMQAIKNIDAKKAATVAGGVVLATSVITLAGKYRFYKGIVAGELKKAA